MKNEATDEPKPERKVGTRVTTSGYAGTITRVCEWTESMVEVRLARGTVCVSIADCKLAEAGK